MGYLRRLVSLVLQTILILSARTGTLFPVGLDSATRMPFNIYLSPCHSSKLRHELQNYFNGSEKICIP
jgi:hypothetical protein